MLRSIEDWEEILRGLAPRVAAKRVFGDIYYYSPRQREDVIEEDRRQLANAMEAWHRLRDRAEITGKAK